MTHVLFLRVWEEQNPTSDRPRHNYVQCFVLFYAVVRDPRMTDGQWSGLFGSEEESKSFTGFTT
jgi:hypothetical protein